MTWEQKLYALSKLTLTTVRMRFPGDWYVDAYNRSIPDGPILKGSYGNGNSPENAVEADWDMMLKAEKIRIGSPVIRFIKWNGYMWEEVQ